MSDLAALYQEVVVEHSQRPRNYGPLDPSTHTAEGFNPLCGDEVAVHVNLVDGRVESISFEGDGCAISKASASLMTQALSDKSEDEAEALFGSVVAMLTGEEKEGESVDIGKLKVLSGVCQFPVRVKCATLAWHTFKSAIDSGDEPVSTE